MKWKYNCDTRLAVIILLIYPQSHHKLVNHRRCTKSKLKWTNFRYFPNVGIPKLSPVAELTVDLQEEHLVE